MTIDDIRQILDDESPRPLDVTRSLATWMDTVFDLISEEHDRKLRLQAEQGLERYEASGLSV